MKFIIIPLVAVIVCQLIKILFLFYKERKLSFRTLIWEGFWAGKFPSTHAAVLASSLYLLVIYAKDPSVIGFAVVIVFLFLYGLLEDQKREQILESYLIKSTDSELKRIVSDGALLEFSGHTFFEVLVGIIIGLLTAIVFNNFI